ncbi:MAG: hypothetical protein QOF89_273 [Acidobacteriota bacterium]|jgi:hypothetical protein|nr:hypothetical protein [Acidobacteriota bacterium]
MVLKTCLLRSQFLAVLMILSLASGVRAADAPRPGEVMLPLKDYLSLVETVERLDRERVRQQSLRETPFAEVVSQRVRISLGKEDEADVLSELEVLVQGTPKSPVTLPLAGVAREMEVRMANAPAGTTANTTNATLSAGAKAGEVSLIAPAAGRYAVRVAGSLALSSSGVSRLTLPAVVAPVAVAEIEMPAGLAFEAPGAVIVDDRVEGGRRKVQLTTRRGEVQIVEVRRKVDGNEAEKLLAQSTVLTLLQLLPDGPRRHDVVLYEVSRGGLGSFTVDLPPGLAVEQAGTDEGDVIPVTESRRLTVNRRSQLRGTGYLVLTSTPGMGAEVSLEPVIPQTEVRARYLALASAVSADVKPLPEASWTRVDLDDLPLALREALSSIDLAAAWRLAGGSPGMGKVAVSLLPPAPALPLVVKRRETTTLMTVDGTLLHRDRLTLRPPGGVGAVLDIVLPDTAKLWSVRVGEVPVRPLERPNHTISIPLGFETGKEPVVEVVSVLEKAIPKGRSDLSLSLPQIAAPVQVHEWRVLLPDSAKYRFRSGELRPAVRHSTELRDRSRRGKGLARDSWAVLQSTPGVLTDRINVGGNESGQVSAYVGSGGSGAVFGKVMDDQGNALPGVTVTLSNQAVVTNAQGSFVFRGLPAGSFNLKAELEGFSTLEYPNIQLVTGQSVTLEVHLSGAVEDVITVTAESPLLDQRKISNTETTTLDEGRAGGVIGGGGGGRRDKKQEADREERQAKALFAQEAQGLQKGLVGGVKPLNVAIPEAGKVLFLTGVLPPVKVGVELEVKAKR